MADEPNDTETFPVVTNVETDGKVIQEELAIQFGDSKNPCKISKVSSHASEDAYTLQVEVPLSDELNLLIRDIETQMKDRTSRRACPILIRHGKPCLLIEVDRDTRYFQLKDKELKKGQIPKAGDHAIIGLTFAIALGDESTKYGAYPWCLGQQVAVVEKRRPKAGLALPHTGLSARRAQERWAARELPSVDDHIVEEAYQDDDAPDEIASVFDQVAEGSGVDPAAQQSTLDAVEEQEPDSQPAEGE